MSKQTKLRRRRETLGSMMPIVIAAMMVGMVMGHHLMRRGAGLGGNTIDLDAIRYIESKDCLQMYGDNGTALGCYQIRPPALQDFNARNTEGARYEHREMLEERKGRHVADVYINEIIPRYLDRWQIPDTLEHRIIAYNRGPNRFKGWYRSGGDYSALPKTTRKYLTEYDRRAK